MPSGSYQSRLRVGCDNVIIYGAGESGRQLLTALNHGDKYRAVAFVDDDPRLQHSVINGLQVAPPEQLEQLLSDHDITQLLLAIPSASAHNREVWMDSRVLAKNQVAMAATIFSTASKRTTCSF